MAVHGHWALSDGFYSLIWRRMNNDHRQIRRGKNRRLLAFFRDTIRSQYDLYYARIVFPHPELAMVEISRYHRISHANQRLLVFALWMKEFIESLIDHLFFRWTLQDDVMKDDMDPHARPWWPSLLTILSFRYFHVPLSISMKCCLYHYYGYLQYLFVWWFFTLPCLHPSIRPSIHPSIRP